MTQKNRQPQLFSGDTEFDGDVQIDGDMTVNGDITRGGSVQTPIIDAGATLALDPLIHAGRTVGMDQASGSTVTLPAATGTGNRYRIVVTTTVTTNDHILICTVGDDLVGVIYQVDTDTADAIAAYPAIAADAMDTITLNGTTTGGLIGDILEVQDIGTGVWALIGYTNANGVVATPIATT
jgi:cytoskeletal protein CcmA (bactofilin family)